MRTNQKKGEIMTVSQAFAQDGFEVVETHTFNGKTGYRAEHKTARNVVK